MQCKQAHEYAHIKCNQSKSMSLLPLLACFSCPRNFDPSLFFNVAPSLSMSMSNLYFFELISPPCTISISKLSYLCTISPPLSSISIKGELLIDAKVYVWGRWLRLESCIFDRHHLIVGMAPLVDTTYRASWDTTHWILIPICGTPPPMSYHGSSIC